MKGEKGRVLEACRQWLWRIKAVAAMVAFLMHPAQHG